MQPWPRLNIKTVFPTDSSYKDETVARPSYLYNGNVSTCKTALFIKTTTGTALDIALAYYSCIRYYMVIVQVWFVYIGYRYERFGKTLFYTIISINLITPLDLFNKALASTEIRDKNLLGRVFMWSNKTYRWHYAPCKVKHTECMELRIGDTDHI